MTGVTRALTEGQYMELRDYEDGNPRWRPHRPNTNLIRRDLLRLSPKHGNNWYAITPSGLGALAAFREKHGVAA